MVDAADLKSADESRTGSSPVPSIEKASGALSRWKLFCWGHIFALIFRCFRANTPY